MHGIYLLIESLVFCGKRQEKARQTVMSRYSCHIIEFALGGDCRVQRIRADAAGQAGASECMSECGLNCIVCSDKCIEANKW